MSAVIVVIIVVVVAGVILRAARPGGVGLEAKRGVSPKRSR